MDSVWYYVRDGKQAGPVTFDELRAEASAGRLAPTDLVWKEGTADWVAARTTPGLFPGSSAPPPLPLGGRSPEPLPLDEGPRGPSPFAEFLATAQEFLKRAVSPNPAAIAPTPEEDARLTQAGVLDPTARRYAAWRRAVLWVAVVPTGFAALFGLINLLGMEKKDTKVLSGFGMFVLYTEAIALFALPVCAVLAALAFVRLRESAKWVLIGGAVSLGFPILVAFVPADWLLDLEQDKNQTLQELEMKKKLIGLFLGINFYLILMPTVLSLLPAVSRACARVKTFLPESLVPGWGLVASVPLFVLLTLATFVLLYQFVGNALLILGLLLWIGAPLLYLSKFGLLTCPITDRRALAELAKTQLAVLAMAGLGLLLLTIYLFTAKILVPDEVDGFKLKTILGGDKATSAMRPWSLELHKKWIEYVGRSLFLTVLFADVLVRMALSVWREERAFAGTDGAAAFDRSMTGLAEAVEPRRPEPPIA